MYSKENPSKLLALPFEKLAKECKGVIELIRNLRRSGFRVYGFSNTSVPHIDIMNRRGWTTRLFDDFFASFEIREAKPRREAFEKALAEIRTKQHEVIFIDNARKNVIGAKRVGIKNSIQYNSLVSLKREIQRILRQHK